MHSVVICHCSFNPEDPANGQPEYRIKRFRRDSLRFYQVCRGDRRGLAAAERSRVPAKLHDEKEHQVQVAVVVA